MRTKENKTTKKNWTLPGEPLTLIEFQNGIKEAEEGSFFNIAESKEMISEWRKQRNSK